MRIWILVISLAFVVCTAIVLNVLLPPKTVLMATGPQGGAYAKVARQYAHILQRDGIILERIHTNGSAENADLLEDGKVDVTFLQAGIQIEHGTGEAIGGVFFEPMLFLANSQMDIPENPALWRGLRIAGGRDGSGTAAAFLDFQQAVGLDPEDNTHVKLTYEDAIKALEKGQIDLAIFATTIDAPYLARAYASDKISFLRLSFTDTISRKLEYADVATIPRGAVSLVPVRPASPQLVLALQARLVISPDLHPAIINRLTMAAKELHSQKDLITNRNVFPTVEGTALPVNSIARQLIQDGPSTWHSLLPYWMAAQVNRVLLLILPIVLFLVPLLRALPAVYSYFRGWQVWQHYPQIRSVEDQLTNTRDSQSLKEMDMRLAEVDAKISQLKLPAAYRQAAYDARMHIDLVRSRIAELKETSGPSAPDRDTNR